MLTKNDHLQIQNRRVVVPVSSSESSTPQRQTEVEN